MENKKQYFIQINGIKESADAVEALVKQLNDLDARISALESKNIKVSTSSGGGNASAIKEEVAAQKELNQLKKEEAAQQRLVADEYANTMKGMKQNLADLKTVINATDLGDSDSIKKMTHDANELNNKLKDIEQSYGQFGRNVGNYANGVAEGLKAVVVNVGGVDREFKNAREASRTLGNELKAMAINGEQSTKAFKDMQKAVAKLNSDIKDATVSSKAMDNLLDTMQSFASIGAVTQGFSALFGFDDDEIQKSIQKLVALQNVMQGIEKINQQINSQEGIGSWLAKGNQAIDSFVSKIMGASKATDTLTTSTNASKVASEGLATAQKTQAVATNTATVATKALSLALKTIGIGLVISAVAYLIEYWEDLVDWFTDTIPALKNLSTWFDKIKTVVMGVGSAIVNYMVQPLATVVKVIQAIINGNFAEIPKIISEGFKKTFDVVGNYQKGANKEIERQQKEHNQKMLKEQKEANEEWLKDEEAKNGKSLKLTQEYVKKQSDLIDKQLKNVKKGSDEEKKLLQEKRELQRTQLSAEREAREKSLKDGKKASDKAKQAAEETQKTINQLQMRLMRDGLNKKLMQLDEEERQTLNKLQENGRKTADEMRKIQGMYNELRKREIEEAIKDLQVFIKQTDNQVSTFSRDITIRGIEKQISKLKQGYEDFKNSNTFNLKDVTNFDRLYDAYQYSAAKRSINPPQAVKDEAKASGFEINAEEQLKLFNKILDVYRSNLDEERSEMLEGLTNDEEIHKRLQEMFEEDYRFEIEHLKDFGMSFLILLGDEEEITEEYYTKLLDLLDNNLKERERLEELHIAEVAQKDRDAERNRFETLRDSLNKRKELAEADLKALQERGEGETELAKKYAYEIKEIEKTITDNEEANQRRRNEIDAEAEEKRKNIRKNALEEGKSVTIAYFNDMVELYSKKTDEIRNTINALNEENARRDVFIDVKKNEEALNKLKKKTGETMDAIKKKIEEVKDALRQGLLTPREASDIIKSFQNVGVEVTETEKDIATAFGNMTQAQIAKTRMYIQSVSEVLFDALNAIWDAQDRAFDRQQDEIDKTFNETNDKLQKALDIQEQMLSEHSDRVESIEDELATARGDRRQHLIDQLNAEVEAQRMAAREKARLEKEQEKAEKERQAKEEKLEKDRLKAEYRRNILQAIINGAMAVTYAGLNPWPIPAIPMMKLAAATSAAQLAIVLANRPYAKGGLLEGPSHKQGGIPVGNTGIEVEGHEYVIRKKSTAQNIDLLDYINKSERKLDLSDFIDFYSSKVKKSIVSSSPRAKYADGGNLPLLNNNYEFDDRLLEAFERYSERPTVVSVVDINSRQAAVKNVEVLAGLHTNE